MISGRRFAGVIAAALASFGGSLAHAEPPRAPPAVTKETRATVLPAVLDDGGRRRPSATESEASGLLARLDELLLDTARDLAL